jgi:hypothetical protein
MRWHCAVWLAPEHALAAHAGDSGRARSTSAMEMDKKRRIADQTITLIVSQDQWDLLPTVTLNSLI